MRKIYVLDPFKEEHIEMMQAAATEGGFEVVSLWPKLQKCTLESKKQALIAECLKDAEVIVGQPVIELLQDPEINCPNLKFIQISWAGTDQYTRNSKLFPKDRILLANSSGAYGLIISQFVIGEILTLMLNFKDYHMQQADRVWERRGPIKSLDHAKVLIFGAGNIGSVTAKRLKGFDAHTIGVCRNTDKPREFFDELCTLNEAESYISDADVIIGCLPNTEQTEMYMNADRLKLMKRGSIIVNVGRGNFIDCMALNELLESGLIGGAGLDVTNPEPLPKDHPLWDNPKCFITPHASGASFDHLKETEDLICEIACDNIRRYVNGEKIRNSIF